MFRDMVSDSQSTDIYLTFESGSVNGARGSLRSKMIRALFSPVSAFLRMTCKCKEKSLFAYNLGLSKTGIWPLQDHYKKSIRQVLDSPGFEDFHCVIPDNACFRCTSILQPDNITKIRHNLLCDFDGLCLDCAKMTKTRNVDDDYWLHDAARKWDEDCRIRHGQPTWYFSFMGRKTDMKAHKLDMHEKRCNYRSPFRRWAF